jgi:hypothetical protein
MQSCHDRSFHDDSHAKKGLTAVTISTLGGTGKAEGHAGVLTQTSSCLASGPGKLTLARRLTTSLSAMTPADATETRCPHRVAGRTGDRTALMPPPFCRLLRDSNAIGTGDGDTDYTIREEHRDNYQNVRE